MSLTRKEWEEMWSEVKTIEREIRFVRLHASSTRIKGAALKTYPEIKSIKDKIESVIGQMRTSFEEL